MQLYGTVDPQGDLAVLAGAFNPPTVAHLALAKAAREVAGQVLWALPERFPHKDFHGADQSQRVAMLAALGEGTPAITKGGLLIDIAREIRGEIGLKGRVWFVCGRDAAERIIGWPYGPGEGPIDKQLLEYQLLVADRSGRLEPPGHLAPSIQWLRIEGGYDEISSSEVRTRLAAKANWEDMVPEAIHELVRSFYL